MINWYNVTIHTHFVLTKGSLLRKIDDNVTIYVLLKQNDQSSRDIFVLAFLDFWSFDILYPELSFLLRMECSVENGLLIVSLSDEGYTRNVLLIIFWMQGIIIQLQFKHLY
jgi:hypothetical protein